MYATDQELSAFKVPLIRKNSEEAKRIFTRKLHVFRNEIGTVFLEIFLAMTSPRV